MSVDNTERFCVDCDVRHPEEGMNCCEKCEQWTCKPFTLDPFNENCDECYPEVRAREEAERQERSEGWPWPADHAGYAEDH